MSRTTIVVVSVCVAVVLGGANRLGRYVREHACADVTHDLATISKRIDDCKRDVACAANVADFRAEVAARHAVAWCIDRRVER